MGPLGRRGWGGVHREPRLKLGCPREVTQRGLAAVGRRSPRRCQGNGPGAERGRARLVLAGQYSQLAEPEAEDLPAQRLTRRPRWGPTPGRAATQPRRRSPELGSKARPRWVDGRAPGLNLWVTLAGPIRLGRHLAQVRSPRRGSHLEVWPAPLGRGCRRPVGFCARLGLEPRGLASRDWAKRGASFWHSSRSQICIERLLFAGAGPRWAPNTLWSPESSKYSEGSGRAGARFA